MRRINKYLYGWKLYVNYGQGWEYECFEHTRKGMLENRRAYNQNCDYPQKWSRGRELNPEWEANLPKVTDYTYIEQFQLRRGGSVRVDYSPSLALKLAGNQDIGLNFTKSEKGNEYHK
jgi:hypothetical protein